jgi:undecaprenyl diphosphate synthase
MPETLSLVSSRLPDHVGIIMDGNGRWARNRGRARSFGHREGLKAAKRVVKAASDLGIRFLTLYTFSTENWNREEREVSFLMLLIRTHLKRELDFYRNNRIRVFHSGDPERLPAEIFSEIQKVKEDTCHDSGLTLNLAINYGGRNEVIRAFQRWMGEKCQNGRLPASGPSEEDLSQYFDNPSLPEPDLIIRTGGELRLSNFLLWQGAYGELYFSQKLWPEWGRADLIEALQIYQDRQRRFGGH